MVSPSAHKFLENNFLDARDRARTALLELAKDPLVSRRVKRLVGTDGHCDCVSATSGSCWP